MEGGGPGGNAEFDVGGGVDRDEGFEFVADCVEVRGCVGVFW